MCSGGSSGTGGLDCVLEGFLILFKFLLPSVCGDCVFAVEVLVRLVAWIVCWRMFLNICFFLLPSACGDSV